jgi:hypothetical protein
MKLLWPLSNLTGPVMTIPSYLQGEQEDQIDLQIKSLMYMFKRCGIANSKPFADFVDSDLKRPNPMYGNLSKLKSSGNLRNQFQLEQSLEVSGGMSPMDRQKLDIMYNKSQFERLIVHDEHRVLIDWIKNRFRSLCILSDDPKEIARLPSFGEYSDKYCFVVLPADSPDEVYIEVLVNSSLYCEHPMPVNVKTRLASTALDVARSKFGTHVLDKDARALAIKHYLHTLAIEVQVERLYRGSIRARTVDTKENNKINLDRAPRELQRHNQTDPSQSRFGSRSPSPVARPTVRSASPARSPERTKFYMHQGLIVKGSSGTLRGTADNHSSQSRILPPPHANNRANLDGPAASPISISVTTRSAKSRNTSPSPVQALNIGSPLSPGGRSPPRTLKSKGSMPVLSLSFNKMPDLSHKFQEKDDGLTEEVKKEIFAQSRLAVKARVEREKGLLRYE